MGLYNFKPRFVPFIKSGRKKHTIREERADGWVESPGNEMYLYTGLRTKKARRFAVVICAKVQSIRIAWVFNYGDRRNADELLTSLGKRKLEKLRRELITQKAVNANDPRVWIDGEELSRSEAEALARRDGFKDFNDMMLFWQVPKNKLPFEGHIIHWR